MLFHYLILKTWLSCFDVIYVWPLTLTLLIRLSLMYEFTGVVLCNTRSKYSRTTGPLHVMIGVHLTDDLLHKSYDFPPRTIPHTAAHSRTFEVLLHTVLRYSNNRIKAYQII